MKFDQSQKLQMMANNRYKNNTKKKHILYFGIVCEVYYCRYTHLEMSSFTIFFFHSCGFCFGFYLIKIFLIIGARLKLKFQGFVNIKFEIFYQNYFFLKEM